MALPDHRHGDHEDEEDEVERQGGHLVDHRRVDRPDAVQGHELHQGEHRGEDVRLSGT